MEFEESPLLGECGLEGLEDETEKKTLTILGGSWVVISVVASPLIWALILASLLITPLMTTHEPPSSAIDNAPYLGDHVT